MKLNLRENTATNCPTHLLYMPSRDAWVGATSCEVEIDGAAEKAWRFKNVRDACLWLAEPES